jgi:hypothetical protein
MKKIKEKREKIIKEKNQKKYTKILKQKMLMKNHETDNPFITYSHVVYIALFTGETEFLEV